MIITYFNGPELFIKKGRKFMNTWKRQNNSEEKDILAIPRYYNLY